MGKSKDLATGETRFVNTAGDTMTGNLAINNASGSQVTLHRTDTTIANDDLYGQIILSGDDADTNASGTRGCLLYTSPSPRDAHESRMPSSA